MNIKKYKQANGFTLIELLVTIAIISILSFYATPFLSDIIQQKDMETAKNRIIHSLQKAKKIANAENTFVDVNIANDVIQLTPKNNSRALTIKLPGRITVDSAVSFTFNATGTISKPNGQSIETTIDINLNPESDPSMLETITISNTGLIASL